MDISFRTKTLFAEFLDAVGGVPAKVIRVIEP